MERGGREKKKGCGRKEGGDASIEVSGWAA